MRQANTSKTTAKAGRAYCVDIRALIYDMLMCHVPTRSVPLLLQKLSDHTLIEFNSIPNRTTVEQMAREIGVISELQAAETAIATKNLTLAFDATTQEGVHINAIHMTTETECVVVAIDQLAGGTAVDYETHIAQSVDHLAKVYSDFHQQEYTEVRKTIISNISNTMSDRAAVNHATITKINALWQKSLTELNCHLHPLDTMASACRSSLKGLETSKGKLFGKDCIAANIVLQLDKMRYKDCKGDPKGFKVFLEDHSLPKGLLPRYRGNRLHILFHTCGVLVQHYDLIRDFLATGVVSCGGLRDSLFHDFTSETGILELCALGLFGKLLTGPWMTKFYAGPEKGLHYLAGVDVVRSVHNTIAQSAMDPLSLLDRQTDFFGGDISKDPVLHSIAAFTPRTDEMRDMLTLCLDAVMSVIDRQYKKQFEIVQTDDLQAQTQTARLHNIDAEELMGMFSAAKEKAPNATLCYLSSMLRAKKNKCTDYLRAKPTEKNKIVTWAISFARKKRNANRQKHEQMKEEMSRRVAAQKQKKEEKERRKIEKALKDCAPHQVEQLFPDLEKKEAADVSDIMSGTIIGRRLCHMWFDEDTNSQKMYYGKVLKTKKKKPDVLVIAYWSPKEEEEDDAVDYDMGKFQLAADVIAGELMLS
ncbi:uncharacterized protein [Littorina saxatilis]